MIKKKKAKKSIDSAFGLLKGKVSVQDLFEFREEQRRAEEEEDRLYDLIWNSNKKSKKKKLLV